jgi:hypothetical protein
MRFGADLTAARASLAVIPRLSIRNAITNVEDRLIPCLQCTRTLPVKIDNSRPFDDRYVLTASFREIVRLLTRCARIKGFALEHLS